MPTWVFDTSCIGVKSWGSSPLPSSLYVWWLVGVDGEGWEVMCSGMETETTLLYPPSFSGWIVTKAAGCGAMAPGSPEERVKMSWCPFYNAVLLATTALACRRGIWREHELRRHAVRQAGQGQVALAGDELRDRYTAHVAWHVLVVGGHHWQRLRLYFNMIAQRVFGHLKRLYQQYEIITCPE